MLEPQVTLQETCGFAAAGLALTRLPEHCTLENLRETCFSADGQYCLTRDEREEEWPWTVSDCKQYCLFKLSHGGDRMVFTHVLSFQADEAHWVPGGLRAVAYHDHGSSVDEGDMSDLSDMDSWGEASILYLSGSHVEERQGHATALSHPLVFSPSGAFLADSCTALTFHGPRILDFRNDQIYDMSSMGAIADQGYYNSGQKILLTNACAACWLPSGTAVVYVPTDSRAGCSLHTFRLA